MVPQNLTIGKKAQNEILRLFNGNKKNPGIRGARTISQIVGAPHRQVMLFLEEKGLANYSEGSYA